METEEAPIWVLMILAKQAGVLTFLSIDLVLADLLFALVALFASVLEAGNDALTLNFLPQILDVNVLHFVGVEVGLKETPHLLNALGLSGVHALRVHLALLDGNQQFVEHGWSVAGLNCNRHGLVVWLADAGALFFRCLLLGHLPLTNFVHDVGSSN